MKILLIEDDPTDVSYVQAILSSHAIDVMTTIPKEKLSTAYDLMIVDIFINGEKSTKFLDEIESNIDKVPPIIITSGKLDQIDLNEISPRLNAMVIPKGEKFKETLFYYINLIKAEPDAVECVDYKTLFLDLVHDLRNDLSHTVYYDEFLEMGFKSEKEELDFLRLVQKTSRFAYSRLVQLSEFLNLETEEYGSLDDAFTMIKNSKLISQNDKSIKLTGQSEMRIDSIPTFFLSVILKNLIENSCKYSEEQTSLEVKIDFKTTSRGNVLSVCDNSGGMPKDVSESLFNKKTKSENGLGIGLVVLNRIISSFDGKIRVESKVGLGTNIIITFPLKN